MSSPDITTKARHRPMKGAARSRFTALKIRGKGSIFEGCELEKQLQNHVEMSRVLGLTVSDDELQLEACAIVRRMEALSPTASDTFGYFLTRLIYGSTNWLLPFRERVQLPMATELIRPVSIEQGDPVSAQIKGTSAVSSEIPGPAFVRLDALTIPPEIPSPPELEVAAPLSTPGLDSGVIASSVIDVSCYKRLAKGLSRFVASTMSQYNPNKHIPTDEELQHQARWIWYEE